MRYDRSQTALQTRVTVTKSGSRAFIQSVLLFWFLVGISWPAVRFSSADAERQAQRDALALVNAATYEMNGNGQSCPSSLQDLPLDSTARTVDPWGRPFVMYCDEEAGPTVLSLGRDGREGTADDIHSHRV
jgi:hypothetical protein